MTSRKWVSKLSHCSLCACCSVEGDAPGSEVGASVDPSGGYSCVPVTHSGGLGPDHLDSQLYGHIFLPGHQRPRRPKLQHSQSILRKQAEEEAIKRSRSLSESYELSSDLQDKQVIQLLDYNPNYDMDNVKSCIRQKPWILSSILIFKIDHFD